MLSGDVILLDSFLLVSEPHKIEGGIPYSNASGEMTTRDFPRNSVEFVDKNYAFPSPQEYLLPQCVRGETKYAGGLTLCGGGKRYLYFLHQCKIRRYTRNVFPHQNPEPTRPYFR